MNDAYLEIYSRLCNVMASEEDWEWIPVSYTDWQILKSCVPLLVRNPGDRTLELIYNPDTYRFGQMETSLPVNRKVHPWRWEYVTIGTKLWKLMHTENHYYGELRYKDDNTVLLIYDPLLNCLRSPVRETHQ